MKNLYTSHVQVASGRDGSARSDDGRLDVALAFPAALGGSGQGANPEQLFAAGYAACFASSLKGAAATLGHSLGVLSLAAEATLGVREDGAYAIPQVRLVVQGLGDHPAADAIVAEARRICAYSNATRGNVETLVQLA